MNLDMMYDQLYLDIAVSDKLKVKADCSEYLADGITHYYTGFIVTTDARKYYLVSDCVFSSKKDNNNFSIEFLNTVLTLSAEKANPIHFKEVFENFNVIFPDEIIGPHEKTKEPKKTH